MSRYVKVMFFVGFVVVSIMSFSVMMAQTPVPTPVPVTEADLPVISAVNAGQLKLLTTIPANGFSGFSPDSNVLYYLDSDFNLQGWDIAAGKTVITIPKGGFSVVSPDGKTIYNLNADAVETWDATSGKMVSSVKIENAPTATYSLKISPSGKNVGMVDSQDSQNILIWDASTGKAQYTLKFDISSGGYLQFFPDGSAVLIYNDAGAVEAVSMADGSVLWTQKSQNTNGGQFVFSPDGKTLAILGTFGAADVIDTSSGKLAASIPGDTTATSYGHGGSFSPDGKTLAILMDNGNSIIYDLSGKTVTTIKTDTDYIINYGVSPVFSPDGSLVTLQIDTDIQVADVASAKVVGKLDIDSKLRSIRGIAFSPDGKLIAVYSLDAGSGPSVVQLWGVGS